MTVRALLATCLLLIVGFAQEGPVGAQDIARLQAGVVRVESKNRPGTGFVVRLESDAAYILTAAHVVAGDPSPKVEFFTRKNVPVKAEVLRGAEGGDEMRGLALLMVRGSENVPPGVTVLQLDGTRQFSAADEIILIGFPRSTGPWNVIRGSIGSSLASDIFFSPAVDTGNSGGPIIRQGKVIGIVMATESSGRGLAADRIQAYIAGFGFAGPGTSTVVDPSPPSITTTKPEPQKQTQAREITGKDGAPMVLIPTGEFWIGSPDGEGSESEHPRHQVYLDALYLDKFEVTVARYAEFMRAQNRSKPAYWDQVDSSKHRNLPVVGVDWHDAKAYCEWAGKRLPTEAEWEKAARGTDGRTYPWGSEQPTARLANFGKGGSYNFYNDRLAPVDRYEAGKSPYGLHHMAGNVWEWTADWYDEHYYSKSPERNPKGPSSGEVRVLRGGSWLSEPGDVRSALRNWDPPTKRNDALGFRCAQDVPN